MADPDDTVRIEAAVEFSVDPILRETLNVAKIKDTLRWIAPSDADLAGYLVQVTKGVTNDPAAPTHDVGLVTQVNLKTFPPTANANNDVFSFAVAAYDQAGNVGPAGELLGQNVDFTAPGAPTGLEIVAS